VRPAVVSITYPAVKAQVLTVNAFGNSSWADSNTFSCPQT
jgi:hypothetical protein